MTYAEIIEQFEPKLLDIANLNALKVAADQTNFLVAGEIHGIKENAHVINTLVHYLGIQRVAVEASPSIKKFIDSASQNIYDLSLIDLNTFDTSVVSLEVAKTLAMLLQEGVINEIVYIDSYFDDLESQENDELNDPQVREMLLADKILTLDNSLKTLCIMGQWHTEVLPIPIEDGQSKHLSALYRTRQTKAEIPFCHLIYRAGKLHNDGRIIELPLNNELADEYTVRSLSAIDYELIVPKATQISLPE